MVNARAVRLLLICCAVGAIVSCGQRDDGRVDTAALQQNASGPFLRLTIIGDSTDPRVAPAREAIAHWNNEFQRLGRRFHFESGPVLGNPIPDNVVRAAQSEAMRGGGGDTNRLITRLVNVPGDIVVILTRTDLISFGVPWRKGSKGIVAIRRADIEPLSLPNTVRNVVAHEIGHALGLEHNRDSRTLMCGRPAPCRPAAFVSATPRFFPLTQEDERKIQSRWP